jgi:hypothetical protein
VSVSRESSDGGLDPQRARCASCFRNSPEVEVGIEICGVVATSRLLCADCLLSVVLGIADHFNDRALEGQMIRVSMVRIAKRGGI